MTGYDVAEAEFEINRLRECCAGYRSRIAELQAEVKRLQDKLHDAQGHLTPREYCEKLTGGRT